MLNFAKGGGARAPPPDTPDTTPMGKTIVFMAEPPSCVSEIADEYLKMHIKKYAWSLAKYIKCTDISTLSAQSPLKHYYNNLE